MSDEGVGSLLDRMNRSGGLPVFDSSLREILDLIQEGASMAVIARAVERDPGLATRVLRLANSAYYGMSREVSTLKMAMVLLGVRAFRNMVLSIGVLGILSDDVDGAYVTSGFRQHCVLSGQAASLIARLHRLPFAGEDFVAGLVHDVGKLILLRAFPEEIKQHTNDLKGLTGQKLVELERELFGVSHPRAGAWAGQEWRLPVEITDAIFRHHDDSTVRDTDLAAISAAADHMARFVCDTPNASAVPEEWADHRLLGHADICPKWIGSELDDSSQI